ncbi:MAG: guanylate kinase [Firmicutes bacterium]|nr:guanylate kinase [Bacillota bacterium]
MPGLLLVVSGPSGAGKGTVCRLLRAREPQLWYSISATTRPPRRGEVAGRDYLFVSKEEFEDLIARGAFLEWARVYGHYYGTPRAPVEAALQEGKDVLLEIDTQGALQVKNKYPAAILVFLLPPSLSELQARITRRGTDTEEAIRARLEAASAELAYIYAYDYAVTNDDVEEAVRKIQAIMVAEKCRVGKGG